MPEHCRLLLSRFLGRLVVFTPLKVFNSVLDRGRGCGYGGDVGGRPEPLQGWKLGKPGTVCTYT